MKTPKYQSEWALSESPWKRMLENTVIQSMSLRENSVFPAFFEISFQRNVVIGEDLPFKRIWTDSEAVACHGGVIS